MQKHSKQNRKKRVCFLHPLTKTTKVRGEIFQSLGGYHVAPIYRIWIIHCIFWTARFWRVKKEKECVSIWAISKRNRRLEYVERILSEIYRSPPGAGKFLKCDRHEWVVSKSFGCANFFLVSFFHVFWMNWVSLIIGRSRGPILPNAIINNSSL